MTFDKPFLCVCTFAYTNFTPDELFRTLGLRQLIIIDENEVKPIGVMTRYTILKNLEIEEGASTTQEAVNGSGVEDSHQESFHLQDEGITIS